MPDLEILESTDFLTNEEAKPHTYLQENQKAVLNRLSRAMGHLEKVKKMVEEGRGCPEVMVQLAAVRSALDSTGKVILRGHLRKRIESSVPDMDGERIDDLCAAIDQAIDQFMK